VLEIVSLTSKLKIWKKAELNTKPNLLRECLHFHFTDIIENKIERWDHYNDYYDNKDNNEKINEIRRRNQEENWWCNDKKEKKKKKQKRKQKLTMIRVLSGLFLFNIWIRKHHLMKERKKPIKARDRDKRMISYFNTSKINLKKEVDEEKLCYL